MLDSLTTTRINWVVQSSAVDFLHLLLVQTQYLLDEWRVDTAQFVISVHDEVVHLIFFAMNFFPSY